MQSLASTGGPGSNGAGFRRGGFGPVLAASPGPARMSAPRSDGSASIPARSHRTSGYITAGKAACLALLVPGGIWTDHLKTEVDFGAGTEGEVYLTSSSPVITPPRVPRHPAGTFAAQRRRQPAIPVLPERLVSSVPRSWSSPGVGETHRPHAADLCLRPGNTDVGPGRTAAHRRSDDRVLVRPFVGGGFKAYVTRRAFFRSDLRVGFKDGVDETLLRFGFGVDFSIGR